MANTELLILCYHAVSASWPSPGAIDPLVLERQIRHLLGQGYHPLTLSAATESRRQGRTLAVTFDDAFGSVLERALPVLEPLGVPATVFVPTDFAVEGAPMTWSTLGRWVGTPHEAELRCMSWEELRRLAAGGWEIGSHTCSHPKLTALEGEARLAELSRSKQVCEERLQQPCVSLAYPFGLYDAGIARLAAGCGYEQAVTLGAHLLGGRFRQDPLALSREGVYRGMRWSHFLAATSPLLGQLRGSAAYRRLIPA